MDFASAFDVLLKNEGALSLDPNDRGNWTTGRVGEGTLKGSKYGISAMSYPSLDIANLTEDDARRIYQRDFWAQSGCDMVPDAMSFDVFDMAVNSGPKTAIRAVQVAAGLASYDCDGVMGTKTLTAIRSSNPATLQRRFNGARLLHTTGLAEAIWQTQGKGLVNRIANNLMRTL